MKRTAQPPFLVRTWNAYLRAFPPLNLNLFKFAIYELKIGKFRLKKPAFKRLVLKIKIQDFLISKGNTGWSRKVKTYLIVQ